MEKINELLHFVNAVASVISLWYYYQQNEHPNFKQYIIGGEDYKQPRSQLQLFFLNYLKKSFHTTPNPTMVQLDPDRDHLPWSVGYGPRKLSNLLLGSTKVKSLKVRTEQGVKAPC